MTEASPAGPRRLPKGMMLALQLFVTLLVTVLVFRALGGTLEDALALDRGLPAPRFLPLLAATALLLGAYAMAARLWGRMVGELGDRDPGARLSLRLVLTANLGRYIPGKIWQLAGLAVLARRRRISATTATAAALLVQGFALAATAAWGIPALLDQEAVAGAHAATWTLVILGALVLLASIPAVTRAGTRLLFRVARRSPDEAPRPAPSFGPRWMLLHLLLWGAYGTAFLLFVQGLGFSLPPLGAVSAFSAAYFIGNVFVVAPAGVGIREVALAGLLLPDLGEAAMPVAILARLWMTAAEVLPAAVFAWLEVRETLP